MIINHNIAALNTHRQLGSATNAQSKSMEKLASGLRINKAGDDAAGLSISEKMRGQIRGLDQASRNAQDGISLIQTAEGALGETHSILQRQRELIVQAGNGGTLAAEDLTAIKDEIAELNNELDGIASRTEFNGKKLLDGAFKSDFQIGANATQTLNIEINSAAGTPAKGFNSTDLGVKALAPDGTTGQFDTDIELVDDAIKLVSAARSKLGANQNRLDHTINNLNNASENLTAAESRIRDVDYALAA
ncbi:flagellin [Peribacillus simplex]|uniref:Flagellin n=1 Tax=Peribacillus simplex TaxID=1478 RepID=A0A9X9ESD3_9BACI|nr:flagellin [Peribacillus simplex]TKH06879.1 flagellin [Peribacillus simplex]TKH10919.1 flagellin [Peribacillus simplex]